MPVRSWTTLLLRHRRDEGGLVEDVLFKGRTIHEDKEEQEDWHSRVGSE